MDCVSVYQVIGIRIPALIFLKFISEKYKKRYIYSKDRLITILNDSKNFKTFQDIKEDDLIYIDSVIERLTYSYGLYKNDDNNDKNELHCYKLENYNNKTIDVVIGIPILSKSFTHYGYIDEEEEKETNDIPINFYINKIQTIREKVEKELIEYGLMCDSKFIKNIINNKTCDDTFKIIMSYVNSNINIFLINENE